MATIRAAIQVTDGMSPAFRSMNKAMNMVLNSFEAVQSASGHAIDTNSIQAARAELNKAEIAFNGIEQEIEQARQAQDKFNKSVKGGQDAAGAMMSKLKGLATTFGVAFGVQKVLDISDAMTSTSARLNLMNDGLQTTDELQDRIFQSAQRSRASYQTTADAISKMGIMAKDAFSSNDELISFTEQINKQFTIAGTSAAGVDAAMLQLTQAMASGVLRGEELNSVFEQAPTIIQAIADYLDVPIGQIRNMAAEGEITADIVKNAMFSAADETNAKFAEMPMTFGQVATVIGNTLLQTFEPVIQMIGKGAQFIYDNWSTIEPIFWGLAAAVAAYTVALGIMKVVTFAQTIAQMGLNAAIMANPIGLIALAIGILIGWIYKWVQSVGGLKIAWLIVMNAIMTAWDWVKIGFFAGIYYILDLWDKLKFGMMAAGNGITNFIGDMRTGVLVILQDMVNGAIDIINGFIGVLNKIPGVSIETINSVSFGTDAALRNEAEKQARGAVLEAYKSEIEAGMADRDAQLIQMQSDAITATATRNTVIDYAQYAAVRKNETDAVQIESLANIEDNTDKMSDSMDMSAEELKYLRDLAEQEVINRFTTAEIKIDMPVSASIASNMDLDGVVTYLEEKLYETMVIASEGVHE